MNMTTGETPAAGTLIVPFEHSTNVQSVALWQRIGAGVALSGCMVGGGLAIEVATAEPAAAVTVRSHDAPWLEGELDIKHQLEHIRSGKKPNFNEVRACTEPLETMSPTDVQSLAQFCVTYGMKGPDGKGSDTALVDLTKLSTKKLRSVGNAAERLISEATVGDVLLDTKVIKPSKKAVKAVAKMVRKNDGCVKPNLGGGMVADTLRDTMPSLKKYANVIAVTDKENCVSDTGGMAFLAAGVANERSNIDVYAARDIAASLPEVIGHEVGHNLFQIDHYGNYMPFIAETYAHDMDVPERYIENGVFKVAEYQEASDYTTYDGGCTNIMGTACDKSNYVDGKKPSLNPFQQDALRWALDATGADRDPGLREITEDGHTFEPNLAQSGVTAMVAIEQAVGTNRVDYRGRYVSFDRLLVTPDKVQIPSTNMYRYEGARLELANSATTAVAGLGRIVLKPGQTIKVELPGSRKQTVSLTMAKNGSLKVTSELPESIDEGNW